MNSPLVSVIITTKNSARTLDKCLSSIKNQTYKNIEIIVVDNNSADKTKEIARKYTKLVFNKGPERSAQRNFGVKKANGRYVYIVDSDFILDKTVIEECTKEVKKGFDAIVVHNPPDITISWIARIRKFETDMYKYNLIYSAARFFRKEVFLNINGYNEQITAGEDYDIQNRLNRKSYRTGFINAEAIHIGEPTSFWKHMKNYYIYGKDFINYKRYNQEESKIQLGFFRKIYFKNWKKFLIHPLKGISFIFYHICKFSFGGVGLLVEKIFSKRIKDSDTKINADLLPKITYIIPTYNAEKFIERCLKCIKKQRYPNEKKEIIVIDNGSTDRTLKIIEKYKIKVKNNSIKNAEISKLMGLKNSLGEFVYFGDADVILEDQNWTIEMVKPFIFDKEIFASECEWGILKDFKLINRYSAHMGIADPIARMLSSRIPKDINRKNFFDIYSFSKINNPILYCVVWRRKFLDLILKDKKDFNEGRSPQELIKLGFTKIAHINNVNAYHYYAESLRDFMRKRRKIAIKHLNRKEQEGFTWVDKTSKFKIIFSTIYCFSIILPLVEAIKNSIKDKDISWMIHPITCFLTASIYTYNYLKWMLKENEI